jgi:hypothetical protein
MTVAATTPQSSRPRLQVWEPSSEAAGRRSAS